MSLTPKTFSEYKASKLYCRDPEQYERCMDDCHETTWDASRAALMAELLKGGGCSTVDELTSRLQALIDCLPSAPYREKLAEAVAEALVMIDHSRASEAVLRKALEQERETSHQLREARHRDMVEDGAELASLRKRLAEVEGELDGLRTKIRERRDEMPEQCWCDKSDGCDCPAHDVFVELGALLDPDKYPYQPTTASQLRTHFGIPEGEDVVDAIVEMASGLKSRRKLKSDLHKAQGAACRHAAAESKLREQLKSANRRGLKAEEDSLATLQALNELAAYHNLPSDLSPMDVVKRSVGAFQEVQARAERGPPCEECGGQGGGQDEGGSWTCLTCGGSGSELDALKREVQALKADIQNREVNARKAVQDGWLAKWFASHVEWSRNTFGPAEERGPIGPAKHLRKEADEMIADPYDLEEMADAFHLVMDAVWRSGHSLEQFMDMANEKAAKNRVRDWPDWRTAPKGEPIEHIRGATEDAKLAEQVSQEQGPGNVDREDLY